MESLACIFRNYQERYATNMYDNFVCCSTNWLGIGDFECDPFESEDTEFFLPDRSCDLGVLFWQLY